MSILVDCFPSSVDACISPWGYTGAYLSVTPQIGRVLSAWPAPPLVASARTMIEVSDAEQTAMHALAGVGTRLAHSRQVAMQASSAVRLTEPEWRSVVGCRMAA